MRFAGFMLASLAVMVFVSIEVYLGHAGNKLVSQTAAGTEAAWHHEFPSYASAVIGIVACVILSRAAHRAVLRAIAESDTAAIGKRRIDIEPE